MWEHLLYVVSWRTKIVRPLFPGQVLIRRTIGLDPIIFYDLQVLVKNLINAFVKTNGACRADHVQVCVILLQRGRDRDKALFRTAPISIGLKVFFPCIAPAPSPEVNNKYPRYRITVCAARFQKRVRHLFSRNRKNIDRT